MTSEESQVDDDVNIYFVVTSKQNDEHDCSDDMWHAFNSCNEHELSPKWLKEELCKELSPGKKDVFVLEEFEGATFEMLTQFKCSIVGPRCLLSCFMTGEPIPEGTSPVFTTAMRGLVVCPSGLSVEGKKLIEQKVEFMGGVFTKQLRSSVTHLVSNFVMSAKYERAIKSGIPVMTEQWVTAVWEASLVENVLATSSKFDKYKCPVFLNLVATSTNLSKSRKLDIGKMITDHGGEFMGALDGARVKIVIAPDKSPLSDKLRYALANNIACVTPEWVTESIKHGHALPFLDFIIKSSKCSTPENTHGDETLNFSSMSTIPGLRRQNSIIEETMLTTFNGTIARSPIELKAAYIEVVTRLDIHEAKIAGPFLDGCNIYLTGFPPDHRDKLNRILNVGSATRLDNITDAVTHVIVGDRNKAAADIKLMKTLGLSPYFLTVNWLEESLKIKSTAAEEDFEYELNEGAPVEQKMEPPSPLSKKNLQLLQVPRRPPVPAFDIDKKMDATCEVEEPDLIKEYRRSNAPSIAEKSLREFLQRPSELHTPGTTDNNDGSIAEKSLREFLQRPSELHTPGTTDNNNGSTAEKSLREFPQRPSELHTPGTTDNNDGSKDGNQSSVTAQNNDNYVSELAEETTVPLTQPSEMTELFLQGLTFALSGFEPPETSDLKEQIEARGGAVVPNSFKGIPDFGVVPLFGAPLSHTVNEIVTDLFIDECIELETLTDIDYYHRPVSMKQDTKPLADCVIVMSSYTGKERKFLSKIAEALGARYQDALARRTCVQRNVFGCTHLVCPSPEGSKYHATVKWKLPAVTAKWLMDCLAQECRVPETPYLVRETIAEDRPTDNEPIKPHAAVSSDTKMPPPLDSSNRKIITPKRQLPHVKGPVSTPTLTPVNKRLNISDYKTPPSPLHVLTPETPYGQFMKPNPSPNTRKRWLKWVDDMPDMRVEEPPYKRRPPSTPLAELRKRMWAEAKKPLAVKNDVETTETTTSEASDSPRPELETSTDNSPHATNTPVKRSMTFGDENSPTTTEQISLQLAQLNEVLQASTPEARHSSGESLKQVIYDSEPADHMAKCVVKDSQPDTVGWEDPVHTTLRRKSTIPEEVNPEAKEVELSSQDIEEEIPQKRKFMMSGIKDRSGYEHVITSLGGDISMESSFDPTATHMLCNKPARNEKFLASIAAGKWVLHGHYVRDCEKEGMFLDEEKYEWGNPKSKGIIPEPTTEIERQIAAAAHRWRLRLLKNPGGAFDKVVALLIGPKEKCLQFQRLITAGGGTVVEARPPYNTNPKSKKITHCFIQVKQLEQPVDWAMMASKGIMCFLPQYLSEFLSAEEPLNERDCVIPEFRKYLSLIPK